MKAELYHLSLLPLEEACRLARSGWLCVKNPLTGWGHEGGFFWKAGVLLRHILLVFRCWAVSFPRHILVREFSTLPLLLVFPLLFPLRKKMFFLLHHNLQWAVRSRAEHFGLLLLSRMGIRWALFETQELSGLTAFNIPSGRNLVLPHPVPEKTGADKNRTKTVIGVAGYCRPEKGMEELLRLLTGHFPDCDIVAGVPDTETVKIASVKAVCTSSGENYRRMLAHCDVLVQNGAQDSYFYRVSGPVADAAACNTAVVVPDFPLLRHQITLPVQVGEVFQGLDKMPDAVRTAVESVRSGQYDFNTYCNARSPQALARILDEFSRSPHGQN